MKDNEIKYTIIGDQVLAVAETKDTTIILWDDGYISGNMNIYIDDLQTIINKLAQHIK